jgi:hypothetical protein
MLRRPTRPGTSQRKTFPDWVSYTKHSIWIYDTTHFAGCDGIGATTAVMDLVTRKWLATIVSTEETSTQVQVVFTDALDAEGLLDEALERAADGLIDPTTDDERRPILLAVSDNGGADDVRVHPGVHGHVRDRAALRTAAHARLIRRGCATRRTVVFPVQPG